MSSERCPICGSETLDVIEDMSPPFRVHVCRECDTGFVLPTPDEAFLAAAYNSDYYELWKAERGKRNILWQRRLQALSDAGLRSPLLDVGCGDGGFLRLLKNQNVDAEGTELSADAVAAVSTELDIPVHQGELVDLDLPAGKFGTVTFWHTLEHHRNPLGALREAYRVLAPGGLLAVAVPNRDNPVFRGAYRLLKGRPPALFTPEDRELHLYHFTPTSLHGYSPQLGSRILRSVPTGPRSGSTSASSIESPWLSQRSAVAAGGTLSWQSHTNPRSEMKWGRQHLLPPFRPPFQISNQHDHHSSDHPQEMWK